AGLRSKCPPFYKAGKANSHHLVWFYDEFAGLRSKCPPFYKAGKANSQHFHFMKVRYPKYRFAPL
ncbi:MAG TPA: hypothetical protein PLU75_05330, partial [Oscillospiraceae bacterium]|nr:hypothetical protein [Oscillospiraceae bacterium]